MASSGIDFAPIATLGILCCTQAFNKWIVPAQTAADMIAITDSYCSYCVGQANTKVEHANEDLPNGGLHSIYYRKNAITEWKKMIVLL